MIINKLLKINNNQYIKSHITKYNLDKMAFLFFIVDLLVLALMTLDTLSLLMQLRKKNMCEAKDYTRVIFTWIFVLTVRSLTCCSCTGLIANFFKLLGTVAKVYLAVPLLGGSNKLYDILITQNKGAEFYQKAVEIVKAYTMPAAPAAEQKESSTQ